MKTTIDLSENESLLLERLSQQRGVPPSRLLNEALELLRQSSIQQDESQAFGIWKGKVSDGLDYETRMRAEWLV